MKFRIVRKPKSRYVQPSRRQESYYWNETIFSHQNYRIFYNLKIAREILFLYKSNTFYEYSIQLIKEHNGSTDVRWSKI